MSEGRKTRRRWLQLSLRTMFVIIALFGGWLAWQLHVVSERREFIGWVQAHRGTVRPERSRDVMSNWRWRRLLGDEPTREIELVFETEADQSVVRRAEELFPEAEIGVWVTVGPPRQIKTYINHLHGKSVSY